MEPKARSLFIGVPSYGSPDPQFAQDSFGHLMFHVGRYHPEIKQVWGYRDVKTYRQEARRAIVEQAQAVEATDLLMMDDDHVFDGQIFSRLWNIKMADPDKYMHLAPLYFTRSMPPSPCIFRRTKEGTVPIFYYPENELINVDVVGYGFQLFDMRLFIRLNPPWFNLGYGFGEDAAFCERLKLAGIGNWVHTGIKIGHIFEQRKVITEEDYFAWRAEAERQVGADQLETAYPTGGTSVGAVQDVLARCRQAASSRKPWQWFHRKEGRAA